MKKQASLTLIFEPSMSAFGQRLQLLGGAPVTLPLF